MSMNAKVAKTHKPGIAHVVRPAVVNITATAPVVSIQRFENHTLYYVNGKPFDMVGLLISALSWMDHTINVTELYYALVRGEYNVERIQALLSDVDQAAWEAAWEVMQSK